VQPLARKAGTAIGNTSFGRGVKTVLGGVKDTVKSFNPLVSKTERDFIKKNMDAAYGVRAADSDYFDAARQTYARGKLSPEAAMRYHSAEVGEKATKMMSPDTAKINRYNRLTGGDPAKASGVLSDRATRLAELKAARSAGVKDATISSRVSGRRTSDFFKQLDAQDAADQVAYSNYAAAQARRNDPSRIARRERMRSEGLATQKRVQRGRKRQEQFAEMTPEQRSLERARRRGKERGVDIDRPAREKAQANAADEKWLRDGIAREEDKMRGLQDRYSYSGNKSAISEARLRRRGASRGVNTDTANDYAIDYGGKNGLGRLDDVQNQQRQLALAKRAEEKSAAEVADMRRTFGLDPNTGKYIDKPKTTAPTTATTTDGGWRPQWNEPFRSSKSSSPTSRVMDVMDNQPKTAAQVRSATSKKPAEDIFDTLTPEQQAAQRMVDRSLELSAKGIDPNTGLKYGVVPPKAPAPVPVPKRGPIKPSAAAQKEAAAAKAAKEAMESGKVKTPEVPYATEAMRKEAAATKTAKEAIESGKVKVPDEKRLRSGTAAETRSADDLRHEERLRNRPRNGTAAETRSADDLRHEKRLLRRKAAEKTRSAIKTRSGAPAEVVDKVVDRQLDLSERLGSYASSEEAAEALKKNGVFNINSVEVQDSLRARNVGGDSSVRSAGASYSPSSRSVNLTKETLNSSSANAVIDHELAHAMQHNTVGGLHTSAGKGGRLSYEEKLMESLGPDISRFLSSKNGYQSLYNTASKEASVGGLYAADRIKTEPVELFTSLVQASSSRSFGENKEAVEMLKKLMKFHGYAKGGIVYASNGALISALKKGTDTVPAMLTPGEFVINRQAAQQHMPVLQAINSGAYSQGGVVKYLAAGGPVNPLLGGLARDRADEYIRQFEEEQRIKKAEAARAAAGGYGAQINSAMSNLMSNTAPAPTVNQMRPQQQANPLAGMDMSVVSQLAGALVELKDTFGSVENIKSLGDSLQSAVNTMGATVNSFGEHISHIPGQVLHNVTANVTQHVTGLGEAGRDILGQATSNANVISQNNVARVVHNLHTNSEGAITGGNPDGPMGRVGGMA